MKKIYSLEQKRKNFDSVPIRELKKTVGWIEAPDKKNGTWDVTTADDSVFECSTQELAYILAGVEEVKAMLINQTKINDNVGNGIRI